MRQSGIGKEIAKQLLSNSAIVIINYVNNEDQAKETKEEFKQYEDSILIAKADVSNENAVKKMFEQVEEKYGSLDYLVNNAGTNVDENIEDANLETYMRVVNTNFIGKMLCIKYAIPLLKKSNCGS